MDSVGGLVAAVLQFVRSYVVRWPQFGMVKMTQFWDMFFFIVVFSPTTATSALQFWVILRALPGFRGGSTFLAVVFSLGFESCELHRMYFDRFFSQKKNSKPQQMNGYPAVIR